MWPNKIITFFLSFILFSTQVLADYDGGESSSNEKQDVVELREFEEDTNDRVTTALNYILIISVSLVGVAYAAGCLVNVDSILSGKGGVSLGGLTKMFGGASSTLSEVTKEDGGAEKEAKGKEEKKGKKGNTLRNKKVFSATLFLITSLMYFGTEIYTFVKYKHVATDSMTVNKYGEYDAQIEQIGKLKVKIQEYKKVTDNKRKIMIAAFSAYTLSAVLGYIESVLYTISLVKPELKPKIRPYTVFKCGSKTSRGSSKETDVSIPPVTSHFIKKFMKALDIPEAYALDTVTDAAKNAVNDNDSGKEEEEKAKESSSSDLGEDELEQKDLSQPIAFGKIIGMGGAALLGLAAGYLLFKNKIFSKVMGLPYTRSIFFSVVAALVGVMAFKLIPSQIKRLNERIDYLRKMEKMLARRRDVAAFQSSFTELEEYSYIPPSAAQAEKNALNSVKTKKICIKRVSSGRVEIDSKCTCLKDNSCNNKMITNKSLDYNLGQGTSSLNSASMLTASTQNSLYNGNFNQASTSAGMLGRFAAKLNKLKKEGQKEVNSERKKGGLSPLNYNELEQKMKAKLLKNTKDSVMKAGMTNSDLEKMGGELLGDKVKKDEEAKKENDSVEEKAPLQSSGNLKIGEEEIDAEEIGDDFNFDFGLAEDSDDNSGNNDPGIEEIESSIQNGLIEDTTQDIQLDSGKNIFNMITSRYFQSAYPKFFKKK